MRANAATMIQRYLFGQRTGNFLYPRRDGTEPLSHQIQHGEIQRIGRLLDLIAQRDRHDEPCTLFSNVFNKFSRLNHRIIGAINWNWCAKLKVNEKNTHALEFMVTESHAEITIRYLSKIDDVRYIANIDHRLASSGIGVEVKDGVVILKFDRPDELSRTVPVVGKMGIRYQLGMLNSPILDTPDTDTAPKPASMEDLIAAYDDIKARFDQCHAEYNRLYEELKATKVLVNAKIREAQVKIGEISPYE